MYTDLEYARLLQAAAAGSTKARTLLDLDASAMAETAMTRQIEAERARLLAPVATLVLADGSRNPDLLKLTA